MDSHALKIPCNAMPFVCETDYSVTHERMFHADRIAPFHVAIYLLRGSMEIIEDGVRYELLPQRLFFLKGGIHHWGEKPFEEGSAWYYAHFYCKEPEPRMQELPENVYYDTKVCLAPDANEKYIVLPKMTDCERTGGIRRNFEKLIEAHIHGDIPQASVRLWQIFLECAKSASQDETAMGYVGKLQEYIRAHYIEGFDVPDVEAACGFSDVFYFSKVFRAQQGCPPSEYRRMYVPGI